MADNYLEKRFEEHNAKSVQKPKNYKPLKVRKVFVANGDDGVGEAIVRSLRVAGNMVAFCGANAENAQKIQQNTGTYFIDDNDANRAFDAAAAKFDNDIDIAVICLNHNESDKSSEAFGDVVGRSLKMVQCIVKKIADMRKKTPKSYGRIIFIIPKEGRDLCNSALAGAIRSVTPLLASEMAVHNVTINSITPQVETFINTFRTDSLSDDIARVVRFLCDEANSFVNGRNL